MRVLVVKGHSNYGGLRLFADEAAAAARRRGVTVEVLDLGTDSPSAADVVAAASKGPFDLIFSLGILGEFRDEQGRSVAELFGCPHVVWNVDYILTYWERLQRTPAETTLLVVDPTQVSALQAVSGPTRFDRLGFFPHPGVGEPARDEPDVDAFLAARPIPVLWSGGFMKPQRPWRSAPAVTQRVLDSAVEIALSVEWMPPHEAVAQALRATGVDVSDPKLRSSLLSASLVHGEVRERRRRAFLMALAKSGAPLHICGAGWEPHLYRFKQATYHGAVDMSRVVELMRQSRIVLNTNANFGAGSHERPFTASLAGAAVFSDVSQYYESEFRAGENIELFSWLDLKGAMARLRALADDPQRCFRYAQAAKALTLERHTWNYQISDILSISDQSAPI